MKRVYELRREHTKWSIEQNPTVIEINRTERLEKEGYFDEESKTLPKQTVRIFSSKSSADQTVTTLAGEKQVDRHFGLLADYEADIKADTHTKDEFEFDRMTFVVKAVYPQTINSKLTGYQCELERVK